MDRNSAPTAPTAARRGPPIKPPIFAPPHIIVAFPAVSKATFCSPVERSVFLFF